MANYIDDIELTEKIIQDIETRHFDILVPKSEDYEILFLDYKHKIISKSETENSAKISGYFYNYPVLDSTKDILVEISVNGEKFEALLKRRASERLAEYYMLMQERVLSRSNWRNYTPEYKNELRSMGSLFFTRYWWKFDYTRVAANWAVVYELDESGKILRDLSIPESEDNKVVKSRTLKERGLLKGTFSYFTNLIFSANLGGISDINKSKKGLENSDHVHINSSDDAINSLYTNRDFSEYMI